MPTSKGEGREGMGKGKERMGKGKGGREGEGRTPVPDWKSAKVATLATAEGPRVHARSVEICQLLLHCTKQCHLKMHTFRFRR